MRWYAYIKKVWYKKYEVRLNFTQEFSLDRFWKKRKASLSSS